MAYPEDRRRRRGGTTTGRKPDLVSDRNLGGDGERGRRRRGSGVAMTARLGRRTIGGVSSDRDRYEL
ncbi:hypothetical protein U1Q18_033274 [Sarracenia purpurea var. burkii]